LYTPEPEHGTESEAEVEISDLDSIPESGNIFGKSKGRSKAPSLRKRTWMSIAVIAGIAVLVLAVLASVLYLPKAAKVLQTPLPINYPVSLSTTDGICYATSTNGVVTAFRVNDGVLLWRHASGKTGIRSASVVDGVIYLIPLLPPDSNATTFTIEALSASKGSLLWSRTLPTDSPSSLQFTVVNGVAYVRSGAATIDALNASDGSLLWHYTSPTVFVSLPSIANGVIYVGTQDGHFLALRDSDGFLLWTYLSLNPLQPVPSVMADGMVYLSLQSGSMDVLRATTGVLLWRYTTRVPAVDLFAQPLVANGVVYVLTQDGHLAALRASNGFTVWRIALHTTDLIPHLTIAGGIIYVGTFNGDVDALRASSGSVLWYYQKEEGKPASITVAQGVIYLTFYTAGVNNIGDLIVLRARDGLVLWHYTPHVPAIQLLPVATNNLVLIALQDGSIDALSTSNGFLRWHWAMNS
jgi:outer membrane protein assembly factor BamB